VLAAINGAVSGRRWGGPGLRPARRADTARFVVGFLGIGLALDSAVSLFLPAILGWAGPRNSLSARADQRRAGPGLGLVSAPSWQQN
jgi:hypothetical protein